MCGIYIHIPFCLKRCSYCDFFFTTNTKLVSDFLTALTREISLVSKHHPGILIDTIYFGGGTPSLLEAEKVYSIISDIKKNFRIADNTEITLESNPEDLTTEKMKQFNDAGVNRLSLGIQSFIDNELKFLTRAHSSDSAERILKDAAVIFGNVNADIIYSLPGQSFSDIKKSLSIAAEAGANHISAYTLTYEEKTPLYKSYSQGKVGKNTDAHEAELYEMTCRELEQLGFKQYEISNFAAEGYESRHNLKYWNLREYLGFGPSAHSFAGGKRWSNKRSVTEYCCDLSNEILPSENIYSPTIKQMLDDYLMLGLRSRGIDLHDFESRFSQKFTEKFSEPVRILTSKGLAELTAGRFKLTKSGYAIADELTARFF